MVIHVHQSPAPHHQELQQQRVEDRHQGIGGGRVEGVSKGHSPPCVLGGVAGDEAEGGSISDITEFLRKECCDWLVATLDDLKQFRDTGFSTCVYLILCIRASIF